MSEKISWVALRKAVASYNHCSEAEAGKFLSTLVDTVKAGLKTDEQVRIKGLGTFQVKEMAPRKSVDVNTGEAITIAGYKKMSFTAEAVVREAIDRAPVEEAVRKEIDEIIDPIQKLGAQAEEIMGILDEIASLPSVPDTLSPEGERENTETAVEVLEPEKQEIPVAPEAPKAPEEPKKQDEVRRPWLTAGITVLIFALCLAGAYLYVGHKFVTWVDGLHEEAVTPLPEASLPSVPDTLSPKGEREIIEPIAEESIDEELVVKEPTVSETVADGTMPSLSETLLYEELTAGSRLAWLAKKHYGSKDLWVFIYEANRDVLPNAHTIPIGTRIRVPKLEGKWLNPDDSATRAAIETLKEKYDTK